MKRKVVLFVLVFVLAGCAQPSAKMWDSDTPQPCPQWEQLEGDFCKISFKRFQASFGNPVSIELPAGVTKMEINLEAVIESTLVVRSAAGERIPTPGFIKAGTYFLYDGPGKVTMIGPSTGQTFEVNLQTARPHS